MGQIGKWIDTLGEKERDAIIQHPDPTYDGSWWWSLDRDCGCLVGSVVEVHAPGSKGWPHVVEMAGIWSIETTDRARAVGGKFPRLARRFTPERMWGLVKARAAKPHRVSLEAPAAVVSTEAA